MTKVLITCIYTGTAEIGDLSPYLVKEALEKSEDYSIFDFDGTLTSVEVEKDSK